MGKIKIQTIIIFTLVVGVIVLGGYGGFKLSEKLSQDEIDDKKAEAEQKKEDEKSEPVVNPPVSDESDANIVKPEEPRKDPSTPNVVCEEKPIGRFTQLWVRTNNGVTASFSNLYQAEPEVVGEFINQGKCKSKFYIEAGLINSPKPINTLRLAPPIRADIDVYGSASSCDGNIHYNGIVVELEPLQRVVFLLEPKNYGVEAQYPMVIVAATGCGVAGGEIVKSSDGVKQGFDFNNVMFSDKFTAKQIADSWVGFE